MAAPKARVGAVSNEVLSVQLDSVGKRLDSVDATLTEVSKSLVELVRLEERFVALSTAQTEDRKLLADHGIRLTTVEKAIPPLQEARRWLIAGVLGIVSMVGLTVYNNFFASTKTVRIVDPVTVTAPAQPTPQ